MKTVYVLPFIAFACLIFLFSCTEDSIITTLNGTENDTITTVTFTDLNEVFSTNMPVEEFIRFDPSVDNELMSSSGKVIINIPASSLSCDGTNCTDSLTLSITEYLNLDKMFYGKVQTISNENLLVTGGAFNWNVTDENGANITLGSSVSAKIDIETNVTGYEDDLGYFVGEMIDVNGQEVVNWNLNQNVEAFINGDGLFEILEIDFGLVNCDVLYDIAANNPTQFSAEINPTNNISLNESALWLFVDDFPSVINIFPDDNNVFETYNNSIPNGLNGTLVAIALDEENRLMFGSQQITVVGDDLFEIEIDYGTSDNLSALIETLRSN